MGRLTIYLVYSMILFCNPVFAQEELSQQAYPFQKGDFYGGVNFKNVLSVKFRNRFRLNNYYKERDTPISQQYGGVVSMKRKGFIQLSTGYGRNSSGFKKARQYHISIENFRLKNLYQYRLFLKYGVGLRYENYLLESYFYKSTDLNLCLTIKAGFAYKLSDKVLFSVSTFDGPSYEIYDTSYNDGGVVHMVLWYTTYRLSNLDISLQFKF